MKKLFSFLLLSIILLKIGGFVAILGIERALIREEMIENISHHIISDKLTCIIGNEQNLTKIEWERDGEEFWFEGELFDVVKTENNNGIISYFCISDKEEASLCAKIEYLSQSLHENSPLNTASKDIIILIFQQIILPTYTLLNFENTIICLEKTKFPAILNLYFSSYISQILVPPQSI
ncbi:hypothetical protein [Emticicia sp. SJ17W-69]|uniref:hypothetical protein n=1 Tax=Emticicia sp. SJ17W-69 TaxID=3421657 RepID=UPI003EBB46FA